TRIAGDRAQRRLLVTLHREPLLRGAQHRLARHRLALPPSAAAARRLRWWGHAPTISFQSLLKSDSHRVTLADTGNSPSDEKRVSNDDAVALESQPSRRPGPSSPCRPARDR